MITPAELAQFVRQQTGDGQQTLQYDDQVVESFVANFVPDALSVLVQKSQISILKHLSPADIASIDSLVILLKDKDPVEDPNQLNLLSVALENASSTQILAKVRSILTLGLLPMLEVSGVSSDDAVVENSRKKFSELNSSLQNMQTRVQVPDLISTTHQQIAQFAEEVDDFDQKLLDDPEVLNEVTNIANGWIKSVNNITNLSSNLATQSSLADEVEFWTMLQICLESIEKQLSSPQIKNSITFLNKAKRFHVTLAFNDSNLANKLLETKTNLSLLKDLPLADLDAVDVKDPDWPKKFGAAAGEIFQPLKRIRNLYSYPLERASQLVELAIKDISNRLVKLLRQQGILYMDEADFNALHQSVTTNVLESVDINTKSMVNLIRELLRKRQEKFFIIKVDQSVLDTIKEKLNHIRDLKAEYESTLQVTRSFLLDSGDESKLVDAYNRLCLSDPLDFSSISIAEWTNNEKIYNKGLANTQNLIRTKLNSLFESCKTVDEYVFILEKYKNLSASFSISTLVQEDLALRILEAAKGELDGLSRITSKNQTELTESLSSYNDDHLKQQITWMINIDTKLKFYRSKLDELIGSHWINYNLGNKVSETINQVHSQVDYMSLFESWQEDLNSNPNSVVEVRGKVLRLVVAGDTTDIILNFDDKIIQRKSLMEFFVNLGFNIPLTINLQFSRSRKLLPLVGELMDSLASLKFIFKHELQKTYTKKFYFLIEDDISSLIQIIVNLASVEWENISQAIELQEIEHDSHLIEVRALNEAQKFLSSIESLMKRLNLINEVDYFLNSEIYHQLRTTKFTQRSIKSIIDTLSEKVSSLGNISNTDQLKHEVELEASRIIHERCAQEISNFIDSLQSQDETSMDPIEVYLVIRSNTLTMEPSRNLLKQNMIEHLNNIVLTVKAQNLECSADLDQDISSQVTQAVKEIDSQLQKVDEYYQKWQVIEHLISLDLQSPTDIKKLSPNDTIEEWSGSLQQIEKLRTLLDHDFTMINSMLRINTSKLMARLGQGFDRFQKDFSVLFTDRTYQAVKGFLRTIDQTIERMSFGTLDSLQFIDDLFAYYETKAKLNNEWPQRLNILKMASNYVRNISGSMPPKWIYVEQLESKLSILNTIIAKKHEIINDNLEVVRARISSEAAKFKTALSQFKEDWTVRKPVSGELEPLIALNLLNKFLATCTDQKKRLDQILFVSGYLEVNNGLQSDVLDAVKVEIEDFKNVWTAIYSLHDQIQQLRRLKWSDVSIREVRVKLEDILNESRTLPIKVRQYTAFEDIQSTTKTLIQSHKHVMTLKNESLKPRHWKKLLVSLGKKDLNYDDILLGDVWEMNFQMNEHIIKSIVNQANNEQVLEENINKIKTKWQNTMFVFFNYNAKFRLVRSWDDLFTNCTQDLNELASMKNSSSFGSFEQEVLSLENRLNQLYALLDVWIEMQREWVYLDGVFGKAANISNILPIESSRFNNLSLELSELLKKVHKLDLAIDVILIPDIDNLVDRLLESLMKLRYSLSEYLERQRDIFPRFYFLGNEDLLELIGCGNDFTKVNKHIVHLFPNISSIEYDKNSSSIKSFVSIEGETVSLKSPVSLIQNKELHEWLNVLGTEIKITLADLTKSNYTSVSQLYSEITDSSLRHLLANTPFQIVYLCCQIWFTQVLEHWRDSKIIKQSLVQVGAVLKTIGSLVHEVEYLERRKLECLTIELIHQKDVLNSAINDAHFEKLLTRELLYFLDSDTDLLSCVTIKHHKSLIPYGFNYMGIPEKLVYTPLISNSFLAMTQALNMKMGGSPFGPAGTGKTESIKALGASLGKTVIVFNCDQTFDYQSMCRIFLGLCKVGCWGCFDEFNRLDESILSAVSSQIEAIEVGSRTNTQIELSHKQLQVNPETGIFVTMNPGYVGRNELPENLKKLFRSFSMDKPDSEIIVEVLLSSQGFDASKDLAAHVVPFYRQLQANCSDQDHYDFGLRSLKSMLTNCGKLKKRADSSADDKSIVVQSMKETLLPKLIKQDEVEFERLLDEYFGDVDQNFKPLNEEFLNAVRNVGAGQGISASKNWISKIQQLHSIQDNHHGIMLVGKSGTGKTTSWRTLLSSFQQYEGSECVSYVIDAKVLSKRQIYGHLDTLTREWSDGLFTSILRRIRGNLRGELSKRTWIVFDGEIDPEWAENLNSLLDDNKILTLPNGERLNLPENVKIVFETDNLNSTSLATVSRCGMVWFDDSLITVEELFDKALFDLTSNSIDTTILSKEEVSQFTEDIVKQTRSILDPIVVESIVETAAGLDHIMDFSIHRYLGSFSTLLKGYLAKLINNSEKLQEENSAYLTKAIVLSLVWSFAGDCPMDERRIFAQSVCEKLHLDSSESPISNDLEIDGEWRRWDQKVQLEEIEPHQVSKPNTVVSTTDTVRLTDLISMVVKQHKQLLLCGPPGSGKTMTFLEVLNNIMEFDVLQLNFSKDTTPASLMKSLHQYCEYRKTGNGLVFAPKQSGKYVVVFCDEINLPGPDKYGCQQVISLLRQLVEHRGFWSPDENQWITVKNIQFVGACNSPKDPGRHAMTERFIRHTTLIMVDYPELESLKQIYGTFNQAIMKCAPDLRGYANALTDSMLEVYNKSKEFLTTSKEAHYIYSPRELTRWTRGLLEVLNDSNSLPLEGLVRLWYHEGLRLFSDRLVNIEDKKWTKDLFHKAVKNHFPYVTEEVMKEPVLFSDWLSSSYRSIEKTELLRFVTHRLSVFAEEESSAELVLFDDLLDHCLRIDRVMRQKQGHMILVGPASSGKSTISKFVAWMNGLKIVQLNVSANYNIESFDKTLRAVLLRCAKGEQICFLIDESSIIETSFIERMNTLLANSEIPGLFEDDDYKELMKVCLLESQTQGLLLDSDNELYKWFSQQISSNLHVIFTMTGLKNNDKLQVISSPALFNRCVVNYMGDWSDHTLNQVGTKNLEQLPIDIGNYTIPESFAPSSELVVTNLREMLVENFIFIHRSVNVAESSFEVQTSPGQFMALVKNFIQIYSFKQSDSQETQRHTTVGLNKIRETVLQVQELKEQMSKKKELLAKKDKEAREMLNKMLSEQNEAERKQEFSIVAQEELGKQEAEIERRRKRVISDLELAEPGILEARQGVQNIKKQHLSEIRSMLNPPDAVKMTMESVCILLGYKVQTWRDVQQAIRKDDFVASIVSFDNESQLTKEVRDVMESTYLCRDDFNFEVVNRASKACGPLLQWVRAQLLFAEAVERIAPLKEEVEVLEKGARKAKAQLKALKEMVQELEVSIESYKNDYSSLIRESEGIKMEMSSVEEKVTKSSALLESLTSEKDRWKSSVTKFTTYNQKLVGNSLVAAASIVYSGRFDQKHRSVLINIWREHIVSSGIQLDDASFLSLFPRPNISSGKTEELGEVALENFVIMEYSDIPLIIDPTDTFDSNLPQILSERKYTVTSFLKESFVNEIENAVRFGGTIIVENCEHYDPIIDNVLRNEVYRNGGRLMVRIGDQQIDFNSNFRLILKTQDPNITISPFVLSRVAIVNFTITPASLESYILNLSLSRTNPEIDQKRNNLMTMQSTFRERLRKLEVELLDSLSEMSGSILDNVKVMEFLAQLKQESKTIDEEIEESTKIMVTVEETRNRFYDLAIHCCGIHNVLERLSLLSPFYTSSGESLVSCFLKCLEDSKTKDIPELVKSIYMEVYAIVSPSLSQLHNYAFALNLAVSYYTVEVGNHFHEFLSDLLSTLMSDDAVQKLPSVMSVLLLKYKGQTLEDIRSFMEDHSENETLSILSDVLEGVYTISDNPGQFLGAISHVSSFLYSGIGSYSSRYSLKHFIGQHYEETVSPILLTSQEGLDGSLKIEQLAAELKHKVHVVAVGSKEGVDLASKELRLASTKGYWLVIQNIQMSPEWLSTLEVSLQSLKPHKDFRLFLTCTFTSKIPASLVSISKVVAYENQPKFRNILLETYDYYGVELLDTKPPEYRHLYLLMVWFHSVVVHRLSYVPVSFTKAYDINDSDFVSALNLLNQVMDPMISQGSSNISPETLPLGELEYVLAEITYGGKVDNKEDHEFIRELAGNLFTIGSFEGEFNFIKNRVTDKTGEVLHKSEGLSAENNRQWLKEIPDDTPLSWMQLEGDTEKTINYNEAKQIIKYSHQLV